VHYSTDYVFDGSKRTPYLETDATRPLNVYGRTKLAGEQAIRDSGAAHLILRSSWVYATRGRNFLLTILRLATERPELRVVSDQTGAPTCAVDLAQATAKILAAICAQNPVELGRSFASFSGTYHLTAAGQTTWHGFAQAILEQAPALARDSSWFAAATQGRPLIAKRIVPITTAEFHSLAPRPAYSVLSNLRLARTFHISLPDWPTQLRQCLARALANQELQSIPPDKP
jgi:dTDP-4-dehydrorhamnose reductase